MFLTPDVSQLKSQLKQGNFDDNLKQQTIELWETLKNTSDRSERYYKAKSIVSEVSYYFDDIKLARESVKEFEDFDLTTCPVADRRLALEQIRCYLAHIQATFYYNQDFKKARVQIERCLSFLRRKLVSKTFRCSSTIAWANYQLGCCLRQLNLLDRAEQAFVRSIRYQSQRARKRLGRSTTPAADEEPNSEHKRLKAHEEVLFCNRRIAIVLGLGIGFCDYTQGHLSSAREELTIARALIAPCNDPLSDAYLGLLLGSVIRCRAGSEPRKLKRAKRMVVRARNSFLRINHVRYSARAIYELALIRLALADRDRCTGDQFQEYLKQATIDCYEVLKISRQFSATRWASKALVVMSRIQRKRGNFKTAIYFAGKALAEAGNQTLCLIDARTALAEANILWAKSDLEHNDDGGKERASDARLSKAREELNKALELNKEDRPAHTTKSQNEKIDAVCRIHIARSFALEGNRVQAAAALQQIKNLKSIEHKWIRDLWCEVNAEIAQLNPEFYVDWDADTLNYEDLTRKLGSVLLAIAKQKYPTNKSRQARFLGLGRAKLTKIENSLDDKD
jgi:tetratricopeptide (TPR) repeat protein